MAGFGRQDIEERTELAECVGEYPRSLGTTGRILLPAPFRRAVGRKPSLGLAFGQTLALFSDDQRRIHEAAYSQREFLDVRAREEAILWRSSLRQVDVDKQGRLVIPKKTRDKHGLTRRIVLVGAVNRVEIWPAAEWQRFTERASARLKWDAQ